jgi:hypothetical protein
MAQDFGVAKNVTSAFTFLSQCEAVLQIVEFSEKWLIFSFDPSVEVLIPPFRDIWFDESTAPQEGREIMRAFLAMSTDDTIG